MDTAHITVLEKRLREGLMGQLQVRVCEHECVCLHVLL
jgi:hypothetical protein